MKIDEHRESKTTLIVASIMYRNHNIICGWIHCFFPTKGNMCLLKIPGQYNIKLTDSKIRNRSGFQWRTIVPLQKKENKVKYMKHVSYLTKCYLYILKFYHIEYHFKTWMLNWGYD